MSEFVKPDYRGGSIVNLMSAIIRSRGGEAAEYPPVAGLGAELFDSARNIVLLVVDGLGADYLQAAGGLLARRS